MWLAMWGGSLPSQLRQFSFRPLPLTHLPAITILGLVTTLPGLATTILGIVLALLELRSLEIHSTPPKKSPDPQPMQISSNHPR